MNVGSVPHWADVLKLRPEIVDSAGQISDLQMSLYSAVYADRIVPYRDATYYGEITEPTVALVQFMAAAARRLGNPDFQGKALFHLDQGMGGGKSHALVGLYHLTHDPNGFFATDLGHKVKSEAEEQGGKIDLIDARAVVLSADNMTPGATSPEFGPAITLYERFLWALFKGDEALYTIHVAEGPNKAALARALEAVHGPVLILLDELMDYVMALSDKAHVASMPGEKAFLNALMDAVDDLPQVAFVVVMIRSDLDERGYTADADDFRSYIASRLERNGITVAVTEAQDFSSIIRRRLFEPSAEPPIAATTDLWRNADAAWKEQVFSRLGTSRNLAGFADRLANSYPFAPDLMTLVRDDWSRHAGFQRVRSTVEIFAVTAYYWLRQHAAGNWAPTLIGVGDIPLTVAIEQVLSSGLLHGNEKAVQGFRQVAAADVISKDGSQGRAIEIDHSLTAHSVDAGQPSPAVRMATALFCYSIVPRAQARRGATKAELIGAVYCPGVAYTAAEEVFNAITDVDEGLGALEHTEGSGGGTPARWYLAITQTLRMFFKALKPTIGSAERDEYLWERAKALAKANKGLFDEVIEVTDPGESTPLPEVFGDVDQNGKTRLVVLDLRRWTLLNGRDSPTRGEINALFGVGADSLPVDNAASCVVACVNTQRRDAVRKRATDALTWKAVLAQLEESDDKYAEAESEHKTAGGKVDSDLLRSYQHYAFLIRTDRVEVDWQRFDDDAKSALKGSHVWDAVVGHGRATMPGKLSGVYLRTLLERTPRALTLKEVTQQFYKNPSYPMVPGTDDIRRAVFDLLSGTDPYEIVDADGQVLTITSAEELSIGSMDQLLRKAMPAPPTTETKEEEGGQSGEGGTEGGGATPTPQSSSGTTYYRYTLEVPNRSLATTEARSTLANLLQAVLDAVDPDLGGDLQLVDLQIGMTAVPEAVSGIEERADEAEAKWKKEDLDF